MGVKHKTDFPETRQYFRKSSLALVLEPSVLGGEPFCCVHFVAMVLFFSVKSLLFVVLVIAASSERETRSGLLKEPWASHDQERGSRILFNVPVPGRSILVVCLLLCWFGLLMVSRLSCG